MLFLSAYATFGAAEKSFIFLSSQNRYNTSFDGKKNFSFFIVVVASSKIT